MHKTFFFVSIIGGIIPHIHTKSFSPGLDYIRKKVTTATENGAPCSLKDLLNNAVKSESGALVLQNDQANESSSAISVAEIEKKLANLCWVNIFASLQTNDTISTIHKLVWAIFEHYQEQSNIFKQFTHDIEEEYTILQTLAAASLAQLSTQKKSPSEKERAHQAFNNAQQAQQKIHALYDTLNAGLALLAQAS